MKTTKMLAILVLALGLMVWPAKVSEAEPMGTAWTYQGRLMDKKKPADGLYDFQFKLYDSNDPSTGTQLGSAIDVNDLDVSDGHFVVELDFGSGIFDGNAVWLETRVVESPLGSDPCTLSPLLELTPTPYALYAKTAGVDSDWIISGNDMYSAVSGNVGIGTTGPTTLLHINGSPVGARGQLSISSPPGEDTFLSFYEGSNFKAYLWYDDSDDHLRLQNYNELNGGDLSLNPYGGNVGIGTTDPGEKLTVTGTIESTSGGFKFPDGTVQTTAAAAPPNPMQIALLRWYEANQTGYSFSSPALYPISMAFDGDHIWVTIAGNDTVIKLRASDCSLVGTYDTGDSPHGVVFDGSHIWVANYSDNNVSKLRASDGGLVGTYAVDTNPNEMVFDGTYIWVECYSDGDGTVTKLQASDGSLMGTYPLGDYTSSDVIFDGSHIWVTNRNGNTVSKLRASDGGLVGTYTVGLYPDSLTFDGTHIWVTNFGPKTVTKLQASDGSIVGTYAVGTGPSDVIFDGIYIWVANRYDDTVTKLRAFDGGLVGTYATGDGPISLAFDGANIWVVNNSGYSVAKL